MSMLPLPGPAGLNAIHMHRVKCGLLKPAMSKNFDNCLSACDNSSRNTACDDIFDFDYDPYATNEMQPPPVAFTSTPLSGSDKLPLSDVRVLARGHGYLAVDVNVDGVNYTGMLFSHNKNGLPGLFADDERAAFAALCQKDTATASSLSDAFVPLDQWTSSVVDRQFQPSGSRRVSIASFAKQRGRMICYSCLCVVPEERSMPFACNCKERQRQRASRLRCCGPARASTRERFVVVAKAAKAARPTIKTKEKTATSSQYVIRNNSNSPLQITLLKVPNGSSATSTNAQTTTNSIGSTTHENNGDNECATSDETPQNNNSRRHHQHNNHQHPYRRHQHHHHHHRQQNNCQLNNQTPIIAAIENKEQIRSSSATMDDDKSPNILDIADNRFNIIANSAGNFANISTDEQTYAVVKKRMSLEARINSIKERLMQQKNEEKHSCSSRTALELNSTSNEVDMESENAIDKLCDNIKVGGQSPTMPLLDATSRDAQPASASTSLNSVGSAQWHENSFVDLPILSPQRRASPLKPASASSSSTSIFAFQQGNSSSLMASTTTLADELPDSVMSSVSALIRAEIHRHQSTSSKSMTFDGGVTSPTSSSSTARHGIKRGALVWARQLPFAYWPGLVTGVGEKTVRVAWCGEHTYNEVDISTVSDLLGTFTARFQPNKEKTNTNRKLCNAIAEALALARPATCALDRRLNFHVAKLLASKYGWDLTGVQIYKGGKFVEFSESGCSSSQMALKSTSNTSQSSQSRASVLSTTPVMAPTSAAD